MTPRNLPLRLIGSCLCALALAVVAPGCDDAKKDADGDAKKDAKKDAKGEDAKSAPAPEPEPAEAALPTETEVLALDTDGNAIPATITAPKGSTIFADDPKRLRVDFEQGELFGVQIAEGNEYNTNLGEIETGMLKNEYGNTNKILEKTETLLRYSMTHDDSGSTNNKFSMIIKLGDKDWVCSDGNYGGWTEEQSARQIEACKTLAAK